MIGRGLTKADSEGENLLQKENFKDYFDQLKG